ncbi:MAG: MCE family protein, partial [Spirulina sp. DLM2.Bin59]
LSRRCNREIVICNGDRLQGVTGISFNAAVRSTIRLSERLTDPEFFDNITSLTANANLAAAQVAELGAELTQLSQSVRGELGVVSGTAGTFSTTARDLSVAARDITTIAATSARQINRTAAAYEGTAAELSQLTGNINQLIATNQDEISTTLSSISSTSNELTVLIRNFNTTLESADTRELLDNLELLTANAAEASNALKVAADAFNDPATILTLQRTMNAARATFENTQKITADLDELTGNPGFRRDLERLIRGLSGLVSSTQQLEQQIGIAQQLRIEAEALAPAVATQGDQGDQRILRSRSPEARRRAAVQVFTTP